MRFQNGQRAFPTNVNLSPERAHRPLAYQKHQSVGSLLGGCKLDCNHAWYNTTTSDVIPQNACQYGQSFNRPATRQLRRFFGPKERGLRMTLEGGIAFCFLLSAFCFLLSAFCLLLSAFCLLLSAFRFLPTLPPPQRRAYARRRSYQRSAVARFRSVNTPSSRSPVPGSWK